MNSEPDTTEIEDLSIPTHDAPIVALVHKNPADMTMDELETYIAQLRALRGSAPTKRANLAPTQKTKEASFDFNKFF